MSGYAPIPELLAPAGNPDKLRACLVYGADAVYLGGPHGNLRSACEGFSGPGLVRAVSDAEQCGARVYYCLNSLALERDLAALPAVIEEAAAAGVHAFIIADPGVLRLAGRYAPNVPVHLSTQANTTNAEAVDFWSAQGVSRVNLARELSCRDLHALRKACPAMELEVFVHGAMCLAVSGQCLLSAWLNARSGNQGRCTQPCRFEYRARPARPDGEGAGWLDVEERTRPGELLWRVSEETAHSSFWAPQDLCLLPWLSWFADNRFAALKIEGRTKSAGWAAHAVDAYKTALDALRRLGTLPQETIRACMDEVFFAATRPLGTGFFLPARRNLTEELIAGRGLDTKANRSGEARLPELGRPLLGRVVEEAGLGVWVVEALGNWERGMDAALMLPGLRRPVLPGGGYGLENQRGELAGTLGNGNRGKLYSDMPGIRPGIFIRRA